MRESFIKRPTEMADFLVYIEAYAPTFPEDHQSCASAFGDAFTALDLFASSTKSAEGHEAVLQCKRHLQVAYEYYESGDDLTGSKTVEEAIELFRKARRFITVSDE